MNVYDPTEIHTQSTINGTFFTDHSDHVSVGHFATLAYNKYETDHYGGEVTIPITYYRGYSIHENGTNISGTDLEQKEAAFFAYGHFDGSVCHDDEQCRYAAYGAYLPRQYPESH